MRNKIILVITALCALVSCGRSEVFSDFAASVSVSMTENPLRAAVDLVFEKDCSYRIMYWKASEGFDKARQTEIYRASAGKARRIIKILYPETEYRVKVEINGVLDSNELSFTTGSIPPEVPVYNVLIDNGGPTEGFLLQWQATSPGYLTFCDMDGKVVWYEVFDQAVRHVYYDPSRKEFAVLTGFREGVNSKQFQRLCDKILVVNLDGERVIEWTASEENVPYPHHDIKIMPDGNLIFFNAVEKDGLWGDGFTITDRTGKVLKEWDIFSELDPATDTWLNITDFSYDLVHGNSVNWDTDGNFYITLNRYNELWKIDGTSGDVLWRFGEHGNLTFNGSWPLGGLHSAVPLVPDRVLVFNNGAGENPSSRAQIYKVTGRTATLELDVPVATEYSSRDRSNVELLPYGKTLLFASTLARKCVFTDLEGNPLKVISRSGIAYRSHYFEDVSF